jgi:hypothetical protein
MNINTYTYIYIYLLECEEEDDEDCWGGGSYFKLPSTPIYVYMYILYI